jgi:hypothetical protein
MATWAGGWDGQFGQPYALTGSREDIKRVIAMAFERRGNRDLSALAIALNGVAAGANATSTYKEVQAIQDLSNFALGGLRTIDTKTLINRNTTAADQTLLNTLFDGIFAPTSYPADKGGGGGGKLNSLM